MEDIYITEIRINEVRNIKNFRIPFGQNGKYNLIITGKNGSGKTSLLRELKMYLNSVTNGNLELYHDNRNLLESLRHRLNPQEGTIENNPKSQRDLVNQMRGLEKWLKQFGGTKIDFNNSLEISEKFRKGDFIVAFFEAKRNIQFNIPKGINKINTKHVYQIDDRAGQEFIQYIVNLKADRSFAKDDNDIETVHKIDKWFLDFESNLFRLFDDESLKLQFDRKSYNFNIIEGSKEPFNLNQLSDGYSAILNIVTELIMRMEEHKSKSYDIQGVVLVDEIETHLHIELQKRVLPFLTSFFPNIQFIVTTHSPFVISSIEDAIICDLEKRIVTTDLSGYSYDTLIESYFNSDKYSSELKRKITEYEILKSKSYLSEFDKDRLHQLKTFFNEIPKFLSDELAVKLQQIRLKDIKKKEQ